MHKKLKRILGKYAEILTTESVVEQQTTVHLKPTRNLKPFEWRVITRKVEAAGGCYFDENEWVLPRFLSRMNLPSSKETPSSRLYIHDKALQNLLFLIDFFRGNLPKSWRDIQGALRLFRPKRRKYSKSTCRDYLGALLALSLESAQA